MLFSTFALRSAARESGSYQATCCIPTRPLAIAITQRAALAAEY